MERVKKASVKAGRPMEGKEKKQKYSVSIEPWKRDLILAKYPNLSKGLDEIVNLWLTNSLENK